MMHIHSNNETDKTINVSKIANSSTLDDNSTAAGCNSRLMINTCTRVVDSCISCAVQSWHRQLVP